MSYKKLFKSIFFVGYFSILLATFIPVLGNLNSIKIGPGAFKIRLDFLLHFTVYLFICLYYLFGERLGYKLFQNYAFQKFILMIMTLAILTEVFQIWIPSRSFNIYDILSNIFGIIIGALVINIAKK